MKFSYFFAKFRLFKKLFKMPNKDKTSSEGKVPQTGQKNGKCEKKVAKKHVSVSRNSCCSRFLDQY